MDLPDPGAVAVPVRRPVAEADQEPIDFPDIPAVSCAHAAPISRSHRSSADTIPDEAAHAGPCRTDRLTYVLSDARHADADDAALGPPNYGPDLVALVLPNRQSKLHANADSILVSDNGAHAAPYIPTDTDADAGADDHVVADPGADADARPYRYGASPLPNERYPA